MLSVCPDFLDLMKWHRSTYHIPILAGISHGENRSMVCWVLEAGPPAVWLWRCQHNGRRLWTTGSDRRSLFTTVDNADGKTTVCARLTAAVIWLMTSRTEGCIDIYAYFVFETRNLPSGRIWMQQQNQQCQLLKCSVATMGPSCLVFQIWPWNGQWTDDGRTDERPTSATVAYPAVGVTVRQ